MAKFKLTQNILWPVVILLIAFGAFYFKPWQTKPQETISIQATGKADVTPNIAKITATIESQNPNLDQALAENEKRVSMIVEKLKDLGVDEKDIKTQSISGGGGYEIMDSPQTLIYPPRPPRSTTQFSTSLEITLRNFDIADEVLASLTQNGAANIYGPNLTVDEETQEEAKARAREDAIESARKKAEQLAELSGRKLGKAVKISEQGDVIFPRPLLAQSEVDLKQKASLIQPGQDEVTINLAVDFELK